MATPRSLLIRLAPAALLLAGLLVAAAAIAASYERPGPAQNAGGLVDDEWLYRTNLEIPYHFQSIGVGNSVQRVVPDDGYTANAIPLNYATSSGAPFVFDFYGEPITEVYIHGEGFITDLPYAYTPISDTGAVPQIDEAGLPDIMIAPFWSNWELTECGGGVFTNVTNPNAPGSRVFTVQWSNMVHKSQETSCTGGGFPAYHTFQLHLFEGSNNILFSYGYAQSEFLATGAGAATTVGIRNDQPQWSDPSKTTPLHLQWGSGLGTQTKMSDKLVRFYPNHAPSPAPVTLSVPEDTGTHTFYLAGADGDGDPIESYRITQGSTTATYPGDPPMDLQFGTLDCSTAPTCTYTLKEHHYGLDALTYIAQDRIEFTPPCSGACSLPGQYGTPADIRLTVRPVNDEPSFTLPAPALMEQGGEKQKLPGWAQDIRTGPVTYSDGTPVGPPFDESAQSIASFEIISESSWFISPPRISPAGDLEFIARSAKCGNTTVFARAVDNGGSADGGDPKGPFVSQTLTLQCFNNLPPYLDAGLNAVRTIDQGDAFVFDAGTMPLRDDHHWPDEPGLMRVTLLEAPVRGALWLAGGAVAVGGTFTMADVTAGLIEYQSHGLSAGMDAFRLRVTDVYGESSEGSIVLDLQPVANPAPVAERILGITLQENQTRTIDTSLLSYNDGIGSAPVDITFIVQSPPVRGEIMVGGSPAASFTQGDLIDGRVEYVNEGGPPAPPWADPFTFRVMDLQGATTSPRTFRIDVLPRNDAPQPDSDLIDRWVMAGESVSFIARATDLEGDGYTCALEGQVPVGARIDKETCHFRFRASDRQAGTYVMAVRFTETRPGGGESVRVFELTVAVPPDTTRPLTDADRDGVPDHQDNCTYTPNNSQLDLDHDGTGDVCQAGFVAPAAGAPSQYASLGATDMAFPDADDDGVIDAADNCRAVANNDQDDFDGDGIGDTCDDDLDGDGVVDIGGRDNCLDIANTDQADMDGDGIGDACDPDRDGDKVLERSVEDSMAADNCPHAANAGQADTDGDGIGDACDPTPIPLDEAPTQRNGRLVWPWVAAGGLVLLATAGVFGWRIWRN